MAAKILAILALILSWSGPANAADAAPLGIALEGFAYPYPVHYLELTIEGQDLRMAYMDVAAADEANGRTVMLMHGKNFFGAYWHATIAALAAEGYRVVVPDQIGFGKSSKPDIHYSFHLLAANTKQLLDRLGVARTAVVGHSMGGMVATRFALMYPDTASHLVLVNPMGLEDYRNNLPFLSAKAAYANYMAATEDSIRAYHKRYYVEWRPQYEDYVQVHYRWTLGGEYPRLAWSAALTAEMLFSQPVLYEFPRLAVPVLLVIGQKDRTTIARGRPEDRPKSVGDFPAMGRAAARAIPNAKLVEMPNVGHAPHLEATEAFHNALLEFLR